MVSNLLPEKGVLQFLTPPGYRVGALRLAKPLRAPDDISFNRATAFPAKPFVFSWPSEGKAVDDPDIREWFRTGMRFFARAYKNDEKAASLSVRELVNLMGMVCGAPQTLFRNVNVVARSIGPGYPLKRWHFSASIIRGNLPMEHHQS